MLQSDIEVYPVRVLSFHPLSPNNLASLQGVTRTFLILTLHSKDPLYSHPCTKQGVRGLYPLVYLNTFCALNTLDSVAKRLLVACGLWLPSLGTGGLISLLTGEQYQA